MGMWKLLLSDHLRWPLIDDWCEFLAKHHNNRAISNDTWQQLFDFIKARYRLVFAVSNNAFTQD